MRASIRNAETKRRRECYYRTANGTCARIDSYLGWTMHYPLSDCDRCWAQGGAFSEAGERHCAAAALLESEIWKSPDNWARAPRNVLVGLTVFHMTPSERKDALTNEDFFRGIHNKREKKLELVQWAGRTWRGVPWPKRPFRALSAAWAGMRKAWRQMRDGGCGCDHKLKTALEKLS